MINGLPRSPEASTAVTNDLVLAGVLYSFISSWIVGTSPMRASRLRPVCSNMRTRFFLRQVINGSRAKKVGMLRERHTTSPRSNARSCSAPPW